MITKKEMNSVKMKSDTAKLRDLDLNANVGMPTASAMLTFSQCKAGVIMMVQDASMPAFAN